MFPWNYFLLSTQFAIHPGNDWRKFLLSPWPPPLLTKPGLCKGWLQHRVNFPHSQQELHLHTHEASYFKLQWCQICCDTSDLWKGFWRSAILDYKESRTQGKERENYINASLLKFVGRINQPPQNAKQRQDERAYGCLMKKTPQDSLKMYVDEAKFNRKECSCSSLLPSQN